MTTVYLLRHAARNGDDHGDVLGVFYTLEDAKRGLTLISHPDEAYKWYDCPDHGGLWDCVSNTFDCENPKYRFTKGYAITTSRL
jgi:hypothetical protein